MRALLASSLLLSTTLLASCVDDVLIGLRDTDSGVQLPEDAELPPIDVYTMEADAAEPDAGAEDASAADGQALDAGPCDGALCEPDKRLGACHLCDVTVSIAQPSCPTSGLPEACWDHPDGACLFQCPDAKSCAASSDCAADEFCFFPQEDCGETSRGYCSRRPSGCAPVISLNVCGCDGTIYPSGCAAEQAGVPYLKTLPAQCQPSVWP